MNRAQLQAIGGVVGPAAFVTAWSALGAIKPGYSPVHDPISRLAAVGATTRPAMTAGFVAFGVGVGLYAPQLRRTAPAAAIAAAATAAATIAVAALPLEGTGGAAGHAAAGLAYATLAATPLLAARRLHDGGHRRAAALSTAAGATVGVLLAASVLLPRGAGLAQRLGLTLGDTWIALSAVSAIRCSRARGRPAPPDMHSRFSA